jgi:hypothetical protein
VVLVRIPTNNNKVNEQLTATPFLSYGVKKTTVLMSGRLGFSETGEVRGIKLESGDIEQIL